MVENYKEKRVRLDIVEQLNRLAREYGAGPHGDAEWTLGGDTSPGIRIFAARGGATPILSVDLPPAPKGASGKVEKRTFTFHVILKNLW